MTTTPTLIRDSLHRHFDALGFGVESFELAGTVGEPVPVVGLTIGGYDWGLDLIVADDGTLVDDRTSEPVTIRGFWLSLRSWDPARLGLDAHVAMRQRATALNTPA